VPALRLVPHQEHLIRDAFLDFRLSREAKLCSAATLAFYDNTAAIFVRWLEGQGCHDPTSITSQHMRTYLTGLRNRGLKDSTLHAHARAMRTFTRFLHAEGYLTDLPRVEMPRLQQTRMPFLDAEEVQKVITKGCRSPRDRAVILLMFDTGLRRAEVVNLDWGDAGLRTGLVRVRRGKGGKARSAVIGAKTRRALLRYRRTVPHDCSDPIFASERGGNRLTGSGLRNWLRRIGERSGLKVTPHALRRSFATASLRAGMDALHLQALLGHSSLEMVRRYVTMVETDLQAAHKEHGPVDRWLS